MREKLTKSELNETRIIQERLDTLRLRIEYALEEKIVTSGDFSELAQKITDFKEMMEDIDDEAQGLDGEIDQRQWQEWNEGK